MVSSDVYEQRVVYAALSRMSNDRNVIKAGYQHWQNVLSSQAFDVFEIVDGLNKFLGLQVDERKKLMLSMHAASGRLVDELEPVPDYMLSDQAGGGVEAVVKEDIISGPLGSPHKLVTVRYLQLFSQHLKRLSSSSYDELCIMIGDEGLPDIPGYLQPVIRNWGSSGLHKIDFPDDISVDDCKDVAIAFYVMSTTLIGPVEADTIVNKAITETMNIEASQQFDPRSLL